jgi:hypothetical protein
VREKIRQILGEYFQRPSVASADINANVICQCNAPQGCGAMFWMPALKMAGGF